MSGEPERAVGRDWFGLGAFRPGARFVRGDGRLYLLDQVGSTNEFVLGRGGAAAGRRCAWDGWGWRAEPHGPQEPLVDPAPATIVVARRQTAGRGRQGRPWHDCGGLHMSVVLPPLERAFARGFGVWLGLQVTLCLRERFNVDARLKWPNDILVGHRKLAGLLVECAGRRAVAGLGLNVGTRAGEFPPDLQGSATSWIQVTGRRLPTAEIAGAILSRVDGELDTFEAEGWRPYRSELACLDALLGRSVRVRNRLGDCDGRAVGIDEDGALVLEDPSGGRQAHHDGDAHLVAMEGEATRAENE